MRTKMSQAERAKQFMPFAALKGYTEALREKEKIIMPKAELAEEYQEEINRRLLRIKQKDWISLACYWKGKYLRISGVVSKIDKRERVLEIDHKKIRFGDIYNINSDKYE